MPDHLTTSGPDTPADAPARDRSVAQRIGEWGRRRGAVYVAAVAAVLAAVVLRLALAPVIGLTSVPYITFFPAVVVGAWIGGFKPGALGVVLSALFAAYFFVPPVHSLHVLHGGDLWALFAFVIAGLGVAAIGEAQRQAQLRAERSTEAGRRSAESAQKSLDLLLTTLHSIGDAVIVTDLEGRVTLMNAVAERLTGWTEQEALGRSSREIFRITSADSGLPVESPIAAVLAHGTTVGLANHTILTARDGTAHPIDDSGAPIRDSGGNLHGVVLVFRDISGRYEQENRVLESEARFRAVVDNMPSIVYVKDRLGRYTLVNRAFEELNQRPAREALGKTDMEIFPAELCPPIVANDRLVFETGQTLQFEETGPQTERPRTYLSIKFPLRGPDGTIYGLCGVSTDITARRQEEIQRQFLVRTSEVLASSLDYEQTLQQVADLAVPRIADWCGIDMLAPDGRISQLAVAHVNPDKVKWGHELRRLYPPDPNAARGLANVLRTGKPEIYSEVSDEMLAAGARDARHLEMIRAIGLDSVMMVPIVARGRVLGAITFVATDESGHHYTESDLELAEALAARAALAIDNARLYREAQEELAERRRVQERLRLSEERFRFALANSDISVYIADRDLRYTWAYSGRANGEITRVYGKTDEDFLLPEDAAALREIKERVLRTGREERHVARATYVGEPERYYDTLFVPLRNDAGEVVGLTGTVNDVTERKTAQDALVRHQAEIEALNARLLRSMRETHHRVKNNLQVVTALVNMQQMQYADQVPVAELARLTQHIMALAAIHDLLTHQAQTDAEVSEISMAAVMEKLMPAVQGMAADRVVSFAVQETRLPVRYSTTLAVLVNELVSNAMKHGQGDIQVRFHHDGRRAALEVLDEGPGFPPDFDPAVAANTGLDLIESLARMDLRGHVRFENRAEGGGRVSVEFPVPATASTPGEQ